MDLIYVLAARPEAIAEAFDEVYETAARPARHGGRGAGRIALALSHRLTRTVRSARSRFA